MVTKIKHGMWGTRLYSIWANMKRRCNDKNEKNYGAKGITVCDEWKSFEGFRDWAMDNGYDDSRTLDRIDPNKNYEPLNCRWCSIYTQNRNTSRAKIYEAYGEKKTMAEWAEIFGFNYDTLRGRIRLGWDMQTALERPVDSGNNQYSWRESNENL